MADEKIGKAILELVIDDKQYKFVLGEVDKNAKNTADRVKGIGQAVDAKVFLEFGRVVGQALLKVTEEIISLGQRGAEISDVADTFGALSDKAGETAATMLGALREGTLGTISDFELMKASNSSLSLGLVQGADDMRTLAAGAKALADRTGGDTKEAFQTLTSAMASGRTTQLAQLGLFVDTEKAVDKYAAAHGKSAEQLSKAEKAQAVAAATLAALKAQLLANGPAAADFGDLVAQARVKLENFRDQVAVAISQSPVLEAGLRAVGPAFTAAFGTDQAAQVKAIAGVIENLAIGMTYVGEAGVTAATVVVTAWYAVKTVLLAVETAIVGVAYANVAFIAGLAKASTHIPVLGEHTKGFAEGARVLSAELDGATSSLAEQTAEAARGVMGQSEMHAALDKVHGVILNVRDAMVAAQGSSRALAEGATEDSNALGTAGDTAKARTLEATRAIAVAYLKLHEDITLSTKVGIDRRLAELEFQKQAELMKLAELKGITVAEYEAMRLAVEEKYHLMAEAARLGSDEIRDRTITLQQEILLAQMTGQQQQLAQLAFKQDAELQAIAHLKLSSLEAYTFLATMIGEKYALMTASAQGHYATVQQAAEAAGFKTRAELEMEAQKATDTYNRMLASGLYSTAQLKQAREAAGEAQAAVDGKVYMNATQLQDSLLSSASGVLRNMFGKSKAAAIAAALIDTYAAVAKAMSAYPWPWNLGPAAAALAGGMAQVRAIRSQNPDGFATGTPGLDFASFGSGTLSVLHNQEAVIPRGSGHILAGEIAAAMPGDDEMSRGFQLLGDRLVDELPRKIARGFRDAALLTR